VKKISLLLLVVAVAFGVGDTVGQAGSEEDAIKKAKRVVRRDPESGRVTLVNMSALELVQATRKGWGAKVPKEGQQKDIEILDVFGNVASVRATMSGWIDYMHLAKWNGRWVIVNVLWEPKPEEG
jgi:hypothetical protein